MASEVASASATTQRSAPVQEFFAQPGIAKCGESPRLRDSLKSKLLAIGESEEIKEPVTSTQCTLVLGWSKDTFEWWSHAFKKNGLMNRDGYWTALGRETIADLLLAGEPRLVGGKR